MGSYSPGNRGHRFNSLARSVPFREECCVITWWETEEKTKCCVKRLLLGHLIPRLHTVTLPMKLQHLKSGGDSSNYSSHFTDMMMMQMHSLSKMQDKSLAHSGYPRNGSIPTTGPVLASPLQELKVARSLKAHRVTMGLFKKQSLLVTADHITKFLHVRVPQT